MEAGRIEGACADIVVRAAEYARTVFEGECSGHDFFHTLRVYSLATSIAEREGGDLEIVQLAALLHDVDDRKLFGGEFGQSGRAVRFLSENGCPDTGADRVCRIISEISFKGGDSVVPGSLEGRIVQDADRLDAIGAVGIARAFAFGGSRGRAMHDPEQTPKIGMTAAEYAANKGTTVNHFYEKLLLLKGMMNTSTAKEMAEGRHRYMEGFLDEFLAEWCGGR